MVAKVNSDSHAYPNCLVVHQLPLAYKASSDSPPPSLISHFKIQVNQSTSNLRPLTYSDGHGQHNPKVREMAMTAYITYVTKCSRLSSHLNLKGTSKGRKKLWFLFDPMRSKTQQSRMNCLVYLARIIFVSNRNPNNLRKKMGISYFIQTRGSRAGLISGAARRKDSNHGFRDHSFFIAQPWFSSLSPTPWFLQSGWGRWSPAAHCLLTWSQLNTPSRKERNASLSECLYIREGLCLVCMPTNHCHQKNGTLWLAQPRPWIHPCGQGCGVSGWQSWCEYKVWEESTKGCAGQHKTKEFSYVSLARLFQTSCPWSLLCPALTLFYI